MSELRITIYLAIGIFNLSMGVSLYQFMPMASGIMFIFFGVMFMCRYMDEKLQDKNAELYRTVEIKKVD